jgi:predicted TPR repeat methyltransferase
VLVYVGDLAALLGAVRRALRAGGRFAFSVESLPDGAGDDYAVMSTHRYAHGTAYLRRMAAAHGFEVEHDRQAVLRQNAGLDVAGRVQVWRRPG